jgi:hypothetical protein
MMTSTHSSETLLQSRNQVVARSFYRQLRGEGFTHRQIIELSAALIDLVTEDLHQDTAAEAR